MIDSSLTAFFKLECNPKHNYSKVKETIKAIIWLMEKAQDHNCEWIILLIPRNKNQSLIIIAAYLNRKIHMTFTDKLFLLQSLVDFKIKETILFNYDAKRNTSLQKSLT